MPTDPTYVQYREELNGSRLSESARVGVLVVIGLNTGFILLDWWAQSERFGQLVAVRLSWDAAMLGVYWGLARLDPLRVMIAGLYLSGFGMLSVIGIAGGVTSSYWPGMMILFLGIPVMLPLSVPQALAAVSVLTAGFVGLPIFTGEPVVILSFLAPVFFVSGAAVECVASTAALERLRLTDFRQRREIEAARDHLSEMDRVKARFTANVHHELRTPLTLTLAPLESLLAGDFGPVEEHQRSYLKTMHVNALRLLKLINNLLDLAKVESDQLEVRRRPIDVTTVADDLVAGARPLASQKNVELSLEREDAPVEINADPDALEKILMNLLGNALKFTDSGGQIDVRVSRGRDGGAAFSVTDSGAGLQPDQLERIFDRFAQVDSSATRKHEGTGIGLSLSKELVTLHGGEIWAESDGLGQGTTMHVWLPAGAQDFEAEEAVLAADEAPGSNAMRGFAADVGGGFGGDGGRYAELHRNVERCAEPAGATGSGLEDPSLRTVLVCEDNDDMRRLFFDLLKKEFNVRLASNGQEGLDCLAEVRPDVLLTDVMMPVMSGIELCERVKSNPETAAIPVILVTSKAEREMKIEGLENGADDYITKPFHARELLARVRSFVRLGRLQEELATRNRNLEETMGELKAAETKMVHAERLAAVGELAAGIAHEINNPVNFAKNAAQTMPSYVAECQGLVEAMRAAISEPEALRGLAGDKAIDESLDALEELAGIVNDGLARTGKLVGDLRDFAAPWKGERGLVDLVQTVESALQLTGYALQKAGVTVEFEPEAGVPLVSGDARAIGQVLLNLLKNAAEAFETPGGAVYVGLRQVDGAVEITVRDNGPGMDAEVLEHLFEPFFSTKAAGEGTGLGLSISHQVVAEHGGRMRVDSKPGGGAEFVIWLPVERTNVE